MLCISLVPLSILALSILVATHDSSSNEHRPTDLLDEVTCWDTEPGAGYRR